MKNYAVVDNAKTYTGSYLPVVMFRNESTKKHISAFKWFKLTLVELIVGAELLESITNTASVVPFDKHQNKMASNQYGELRHLNLHIPSGIITNFLRKQIIELLYYKFHHQYLLLNQVGESHVDEENRIIDLTRTRFRARKELFNQLISLRRTYDLSWLVFNVSVDIAVYLYSNQLEIALLTALGIEAVRRVLKL